MSFLPVKRLPRVPRGRPGLAIWVATLGVIATVASSLALMQQDRRQVESRFALLTEERIKAIHVEITKAIDASRVVTALVEQQTGEQSEALDQLMPSLLDAYPQIEAIGWVEGRTRVAGDRPTAGELEITGIRHTAIRDDLAFDVQSMRQMFAESNNWQKPFAAARRTSEDSTHPLKTACRVAIARPVRSGTSVVQTPEGKFHHRRWLVVELDLGAVVDEALDRLISTEIDFALYEFDANGNPRQQYVGLAGAALRNSDSFEFDEDRYPAGLSLQRETRFTIAGQPWSIVATPTRQFFVGQSMSTGWIMLIAGLFVSAVLGAYVSSLCGRNARIEQQVEERTRQLKHANKLLQEEVSIRKRMEQRLQIHANQLESANVDLESARCELATAVEELEERNQELDEFTYVASHDLQEPMRKLISFSSLLKQDIDGEMSRKVEQDLHFIVDAAQRMKILIQDLLVFSRAGRSAMKNAPVNLEDCVKQAVESLALRIDEKGAEVRWQNLPTIQGDETMLTQLMQNLLSNALKFNESDIPTVEIDAELVDDEWQICVADNGIGMKPKYLERVFQPFQRLHGRGSYEGTGIGLAICKKTVHRHGGRIWVESKPDEGSRFLFTLPTTTGDSECPDSEPNESDLLSC